MGAKKKAKRALATQERDAKAPKAGAKAADMDAGELSPLARAFHDGGYGVEGAAALMDSARMFGQVCFARSGKQKEDGRLFKAARQGFLAALGRGSGLRETLRGSVEGVMGALDPLRAPGPPSIDEGKALMKAKGPGLLGDMVKLSDFETLDWLAPGALRVASLEDWRRVDWVARKLCEDPPSLRAAGGGSGPGQDLDPAAIEAALEGKASALMERFGLPGLRISGFPSHERASATLDSMSVALEELARAARVPEDALGLGEWTFNVNAYMDRASGYACSAEKVVCLSPDNGWRTMAHEWFHALDMQSAEAAGLGWATSVAGDRLREGGSLKEPKEPKELSAKAARASEVLAAAAARLMGAIRKAPAKADGIKQVAAEPVEMAVERVTSGLYERFYMNRVERDEPKARAEFKRMCADLLEGRGGLDAVAGWRKEHLGAKAEMSKHYDGFVFAEREARRARDAKGSSSPASALERFAKIADESLNKAAGNKEWTGYSNSSLEMAARGFEGNCFLDTKPETRPFLVDGKDNTLYWPVGSERGANAKPYLDFISAAHGVLVAAGSVPASKAVAIPEMAVASKLALRRAGSAKQPELAASAPRASAP